MRVISVINLAIECCYFLPGLLLPSWPWSVTDVWSVSNYAAWRQRHMCARCSQSHYMAMEYLMMSSPLHYATSHCSTALWHRLFVVVGATYCAISSLVLLHRLRSVLKASDIELVRCWCVGRLSDTKKTPDCFSAFCILATITVSMPPFYCIFINSKS